MTGSDYFVSPFYEEAIGLRELIRGENLAFLID